jgi:hypothetical protein
LEEEIPALFILGYTARGLATALATAVLGPRPDSRPGEERLRHWINVYNIRRSVVPLIGFLAVAVVTHTHTHNRHPLPPLGSEEYPGAAIQHPLRLELGAPAAACGNINGHAREGDDERSLGRLCTWCCVTRCRWTKVDDLNVFIRSLLFDSNLLILVLIFRLIRSNRP